MLILLLKTRQTVIQHALVTCNGKEETYTYCHQYERLQGITKHTICLQGNEKMDRS